MLVGAGDIYSYLKNKLLESLQRWYLDHSNQFSCDQLIRWLWSYLWYRFHLVSSSFTIGEDVE